MLRLTVRAALATLVVATGCLLAPVATPGAGAAPAAACTGSSGVTVVVDFGAIGGGQQMRCAAGDPASGLDALAAAGFSYSFVPNKGPFVCTIGGKPDPCNGAPANAYWSYWTASRGGSWSYSNVGAHQRDPAPGSVEGWSFGAGSAPGVAPPAAPTTTAAPPPPPPPTAAPRPPATQPPATQPPPPPANDTPPASTDVAPATTEPAGDGPRTGGETGEETDDNDSTDDTDSSQDPMTTTDRSEADDDGDARGEKSDGDDENDEIADETAALDTDNTSSSSGSGVGAVLALTVAVAIGGSAVWEVRRRRAPS